MSCIVLPNSSGTRMYTKTDFAFSFIIFRVSHLLRSCSLITVLPYWRGRVWGSWRCRSS